MHSCLTSPFKGEDWTASCPGRRTAGEETLTHETGGWVGPSAGLDTLEKRQICCPYRESSHDSLVVQLVTITIDLSRIGFQWLFCSSKHGQITKLMFKELFD